MMPEKLVCPACQEPAERGRPVDATQAGQTGPRYRARHSKDKTMLCPEMTGQGYKPYYPEVA